MMAGMGRNGVDRTDTVTICIHCQLDSFCHHGSVILELLQQTLKDHRAVIGAIVSDLTHDVVAWDLVRVAGKRAVARNQVWDDSLIQAGRDMIHVTSFCAHVKPFLPGLDKEADKTWCVYRTERVLNGVSWSLSSIVGCLEAKDTIVIVFVPIVELLKNQCTSKSGMVENIVAISFRIIVTQSRSALIVQLSSVGKDGSKNNQWKWGRHGQQQKRKSLIP